MIPKIIHYCWLSDDKHPKKIQHCIASWQKRLPDYEIWLWDLNRFDINSSIWCKQAFEKKKYPFAADYIRLYAVYNYGGIYLDSDVEVLKSFDDLLHLPYFVGYEAQKCFLELAAFGAEKGTDWVGDMLEYYTDREFIKPDGTFDIEVQPVIAQRRISASKELKSIEGIADFDYNEKVFNIFPRDWFCANAHIHSGEGTQYIVSDNTYCVHHFANSWVEQKGRIRFLRALRKFMRITRIKKVIRMAKSILGK